MRREWHIWEKILTLENCREAVRREALTKRCKRNGFSVVLRADFDHWAKYVRERIGDGLRLGPFEEFDTIEHGKPRHVRCYTPTDAMCVRACVLQMEPRVYARQVPQSYCPIPGRGGLRLARDLRRALARMANKCRVHNKYHPKATEWRPWVETFDEQKYYDSLTYNVMWEPMERIFGEPEVLGVLQAMLWQRDTLPIGAGYSAMVANAVLASLDWEIVGTKGVSGYARHLDNAAVVMRSKATAKAVRELVEDWNEAHGLVAHEWAKYPADHHAVECGGWRIDEGRIIPSVKVTKHLYRLLDGDVDSLTLRDAQALASMYGYVKNGESKALQDLWTERGAWKTFRRIGVTAKEAEAGVIFINQTKGEKSK